MLVSIWCVVFLGCFSTLQVPTSWISKCFCPDSLILFYHTSIKNIWKAVRNYIPGCIQEYPGIVLFGNKPHIVLVFGFWKISSYPKDSFLRIWYAKKTWFSPPSGIWGLIVNPRSMNHEHYRILTRITSKTSSLSLYKLSFGIEWWRLMHYKELTWYIVIRQDF